MGGKYIHTKLLNRYHQTMINGMFNTTEIVIHIILERKTKKNYCYRSSDNEENKKRRMRKRKNKESIDEISQGLLIKQKNPKKIAAKKMQIVLPETEPK